MKLNEQQQRAADRCLGLDPNHKWRVVAVTGPAGTGKTTIIRTVYERLVDAGYSPTIAAPTGKAARRVVEATGCPAKTIHMLLEFPRPNEIDPKTGKYLDVTLPKRNKSNPLEHDTVIVDEYAMVNRDLHRQLVDAMPTGSRLLVFGDNQQLPPIEPRQTGKPPIFKELLDKCNGIVLDTVMRQDADSGVLANARRILQGVAPVDNDDFLRIITDKPIDALVVETQRHDFRKLHNQIIVPGNNGWTGTAKLNILLQMLLWPEQRPMLALPRHPWSRYKDFVAVVGNQRIPFKAGLSVGVGDKVMMTSNWYDLECADGTYGVMNGEVGIVIDIDEELGEVVVDFDNRVCRIPPIVQTVHEGRVRTGYPQKDLELAYAVTTHKMQGSECQHVCYVLNKSAISMCNRRNFYTAVTRARRSVTLITDTKALSMSVTRKEPMEFAQ
jgi:exodeoxyribonuclease V alpha subunit